MKPMMPDEAKPLFWDVNIDDILATQVSGLRNLPGKWVWRFTACK
jgi:hypothetical protein